MRGGQSLSLFDKGRWHGKLMDWAMRDTRFKTQLFRFVDVLPVLGTPGAVLSHLREYFGGQFPFLKPLIAVAGWAPPVTSWIIRRNIRSMANQFIAGETAQEALPMLEERARQGVGFTVDILGETAVSEREAEVYGERYLELMEILARRTEHWLAADAGGGGPRVNVSIKISALHSQIHPADPKTAIERLKERLRPLLRRARELGVFMNFDMESNVLKDLTLDLFKSLLEEPEFVDYRNLGIVIQAYLRDSGRDLDAFIRWAENGPAISPSGW